jgi:hypothetical protein
MVTPEEPPTETLRRFVDRAEELQTRQIIQDDDLRSSLQIKGEMNQPVAMSHHEPNEENLRSYLMDFRKFTLKHEPVFINRVLNLAHRHITGEVLVRNLADARRGWKESMTHGDIAFLVNNERLEPEHVLDLWINGYYFHDDLEKARKLEALSRVPLSRWLFINVLVKATQILIYVAHHIKIALREGLIADSAIRG